MADNTSIETEQINILKGQVAKLEAANASLIVILRDKVKNSSDKNAVERARKGAYVDCICLINEINKL